MSYTESVDDEWNSFVGSMTNSSAVVGAANNNRIAYDRTENEHERRSFCASQENSSAFALTNEDDSSPLNNTRTSEDNADISLLSKSIRAKISSGFLRASMVNITRESSESNEYADIPAKCIPFIDNDKKCAVESRSINAKVPECSPLHISTKTKVLFLNCEIDTLATFWKIPLIDYWRPCEGVIKKQTKVTSNSLEEFEEAQERLRTCGHHYNEMIIKSAAANAQTKRLKYKDDRKVTIGISKKDIMNCRGKQKKAFMNCFAIIIRIRFKGEFREVHVKVFNTGKLEIPGVPEDEMLDVVREKVIEYLQPHLGVNPLQYKRGNGDGGDEDVLINSGFHCGFCIDQKAFYGILRSEKYEIETSYDSCHYPGIRCKYYYRNGLAADDLAQNGRIAAEDNGIKMSQLELSKKYTCVSFMIFSTGNCLVVGNCSKAVLLHVFEFIKRTLVEEYAAIRLPNESTATKLKKKKQRKKTVNMQMQYYTGTAAK